MENNKLHYSLTHPQKRIWYIEQFYSGHPLNNIGGCLKIQGNINFNLLDQAINEVIAQNDSLRIRIDEEKKEPYQYISEIKEEKIDYYDFSDTTNGEENQKQWAKELFSESFVFHNSPLYYFAVYKINESSCGVFLKIHHIIADGWSVYHLIQKQICENYDFLLKNQQQLEDTNVSYVDFIAKENEYIESSRFEKHKSYWMDKLTDMPDASLYKSTESPVGKRHEFHMSEERSLAIKTYLKMTGSSLSEFFTGVLMLYLKKTTSNEDITISLPVLNRPGAKYKNATGMFISTMPFRLTIDSNMSIKEYYETLRLEFKRHYRHQKYPYNLMMSDMKIAARGYDSFFKISLNCYNVQHSERIAGYHTELEEIYSGYQSYALQIVVKEWMKNDLISMNFDYRIEEYSESEIIRMFDHFNVLIDQIIDENSRKLKTLSLLSVEESDYFIHTKNARKSQNPNVNTIQDLFEEQARKTPNKIALIQDGHKESFKSLKDKSDKIAQYLKSRITGKNKVIAIIGDHSVELIATILGILKSSAAYLPIDQNYPIERINYMLEDSQASLLLTNVDMKDELRFDGEIIGFEDIINESKNLEIPQIQSDKSDLAYIIYTSGSTGKPKGVMIHHESLINYAWWGSKEYMGTDEVFAFYTSLAFDLTVTSLFIPLISGNTIAIYNDDGSEFILDKIMRDNISTMVKLTPSHLSLIKDKDNSQSSIRKFIVGGEDLKVSLAKEIYDSFDGKVELFNEYGPTEATVGCMIHKYQHGIDTGISVPIGNAIDNTQIYLLDEDLNPVAQGIDGEIFISGQGLSKGYLNNKLANKRFIDNPFISGEKMYRTGDIARYMENDLIHYQGRLDNQVKIRGHRIELGEIEECLNDYPLIKEAVVLIKEKNEHDKLIYAFVVGTESVDDNVLNQWLSKRIPKYMLPTMYVFLEVFPLTVNGKVDISGLLNIEVETDSNESFVKAKTEIEKVLVSIMKDVLMLNSISMKDNFYRIGGDSIKAIQITSKLSSLGYNTSLKNILSKDTIEDIAREIEANEESMDYKQEASEGVLVNTPIMEWFFSNNFSSQHHYNQSVLLVLNSSITIDQLNSVLKVIIEQHDALRLNLDSEKNKLYYNKKHLEMTQFVDVYDLCHLERIEQEKEITRIGNDIKSGFNLERDLLLKSVLIKLSEEEELLLLSAHHLIIDGVSWRIFLQDFSDLLEKLANKEILSLPPKRHSYGEWSEKLLDYSKTLSSETIDYWKEIEAVKISIKTDFESDEDSFKSSNTVEAIMTNDCIEEFKNGLDDIYNMTLDEGLIVALILTVNEFSNMDTVLLELEGHGREDIGMNLDISRTIGWFTSMYPVAFNVEETELRRKIMNLKDQLKTVPNKGFDYGVSKYLKKSIGSFTQEKIRFNYLGDFDNSLSSEFFKSASINSGMDIGEDNHLTALLDINIMRINHELKMMLTYSEKRFKSETMMDFLELYKRKIQDIMIHCNEKEGVELTTSDFETVDLSQDDLDNLFIG